MKILKGPLIINLGDFISEYQVEFSDSLRCPHCQSKLFRSIDVPELYKLCVICKDVLAPEDGVSVIHSGVDIFDKNDSLTILALVQRLDELGYDLRGSAGYSSDDYFIV